MSTTFALRLGALRARTRLGHESAERAWPQEVLIDVEVELRAPPLACRSDRLKDTLCADQLAVALVTLCEAGEHRLIEHLAERLRDEARRLAPPGARVTLALTKVAPPITGLEGGMSVMIGDRGSRHWRNPGSCAGLRWPRHRLRGPRHQRS